MARLTEAQTEMLLNIRDHDSPYFGIRGMSAHGGATQTVWALRRKELIDADHRLTTAGRELIDKLHPPTLSSTVREVLRAAGMTEYPHKDWGFAVRMGTHGVAHVTYVSPTDATRRESALKFGNHEVTSYVRALQDKGFRVSRVNGVKSVDRLLVMEK